MSQSIKQIANLLTRPSLDRSNQKAVQYLDNNFHSFDQLEELELLVLDAQRCHEELQFNVGSSQSRINILLLEATDRAQRYANSAQELSLFRHSLADDISELPSELVSVMSDGDLNPTLLEDIETLHRNLKELENVKGYVMVIEHALKLSESSVNQVRTEPTVSLSSIQEYEALHNFVTRVSDACSNTEDSDNKQTVHLVDFLEKVRDKCWVDIKGYLSSQLSSAAEQLGWPMQMNYITASTKDKEAFNSAFFNLLKLQSLSRKFLKENSSNNEVMQGLYPIQAIVQPLSLRFKYHFEGSRQTNRLDKPEWYFEHVLNAVHEHRTFMEVVVQKLLSSTEYKHIDAWREFTNLLLLLLVRKLKRTVPSMLSRPSLLAHTIYQSLSFDASLTEEGFTLKNTSAWGMGGNSDENWSGISEYILGHHQWFDAWLAGEQKFVEDQYNDIINASDAWMVADDEADSESRFQSLKTTNSARRIKTLIEQITDRYSPLPHATQKVRFLNGIQLPLLSSYHTRISSSLDAFETLSSAFIRAVPGSLSIGFGNNHEGAVHVDTGKLTSGVEGVQRLCKALLSAAFLSQSMKGWADESFFLELWTELCHNPSMRNVVDENLLLPTPRSPATITYDKATRRAEEMIMQQICGEIEHNLKAHLNASTTNKADEQEAHEIALSQTLLGPIALLSSHLNYIRLMLPLSIFTVLYRRLSSRLADHIIQRQILYRGSFDLREGKIMRAECELWVETCHAVLQGSLGGGKQRVEAPWAKLLQAARLVGTEGEAWNEVVDATFGVQSEETWENIMLKTVGITELDRQETANVLKRRVDCAP
ncbi:TIP-1 family-domain-containing protein [Cyathus striatus]|nr:TIP-1 family-domain-containing protein [Cyathus striatus]